MENAIINDIIAKNLIYYRKEAGLTQAELAEKINYSDKSVSKWESGNGVPDVYTLIQLAQLYGVTVNALVGEDTPAQRKKKVKGLHLLIMLLSSGIVWLIASCLFVALQLLQPGGAWWLAFVYAIVANAIVLLVYGALWKHRILNFLAISTIIWITLLSLYLTITLIKPISGLWLLFLIGIPLQVLEVLWAFFRSLLRKKKQD